MLLTISRSLSDLDAPTLLNFITENDVIFLYQDGVTAAVNQPHLALLQSSQAKIYALSDDLAARGLTRFCSPHVTPITHAEWVQLTVEHTPQMAW